MGVVKFYGIGFMNYIEITSRNNDKVKYVCKLVANAKERKQSGLFVCEGMRLCLDAAKSGCEIEEVYITNDALIKFAAKAEELTDIARKIFIITDEVADKLSDTVNSQGVFCVAAVKKNKEVIIDNKGKYIALDNLQNPLNLGAVARTAEALGVDALITAEGCDIYNPKALRASMGSLMRLPVFETDSLESIIEQANNDGMLTFATVPDSSAEDITTLCFDGGVIAVIGNEGNGVSQKIMDAAAKKVTIRMKGNAESFNASAAAVITMWEMMR